MANHVFIQEVPHFPFFSAGRFQFCSFAFHQGTSVYPLLPQAFTFFARSRYGALHRTVRSGTSRAVTWNALPTPDI